MTSPIAIVSLAGRYPKADDLAQLWDNLASGLDAISTMRGDRWDLGHIVAGSSNPERIYTSFGGFLDRIDAFDAEFFGMSPREAKQVDPQHRLLLEVTWEAFERAGIVPAAVAGSRTGVYVGISQNDYATLSLGGDAPDAYTNIGSAISIAANRISYVFDLHGPSMSIDTACSSSMVAIHQACQALARGEIAMALAGGINMLISARPFAGFARASMLSPEGRCKSFDAGGNGYVRAEGAGMLVLKRLADAQSDGDPVLAVIRATAVNSDGRTMGLALPNGAAQEALLRQIYEASGTRAEDVFYVEAHGTGTAAGDPIECGAIGRVLGAPRRDGTKLRIGSIKSNIGHLESGAGIAGITKVVLAMQHGVIPANLHFATPNPKIDFDGWQLEVVDRPVPLPARERPLVFGVNSFGFGGTNGHMVIEQYHQPKLAAPVHPAGAWDGFLVLSAHSQAALEILADQYIARLDQADAAQWAAIRGATLRYRSLHPLRLCVVADDAAQAAERLKAWRAGDAPAGVLLRKTTVTHAPGSRQPAFVYSGNGPQWWGMGRELLAQSAAFRAAIAEVDGYFQPLSGWSLIERMALPEDQVDITLTEVAQPMLFAQQVALTRLLREAGIIPAAVFGHSVGEVAAAWASGALSLEAATTVIYQRSAEQAKTRGAGKMAAVGISAAEAEALIAELALPIELAAVNGPRAATVAGPEGALEQLAAVLTERGEFVRILALDYAFHTSAMDVIHAPLLAALAELAPGTATVPMISSVTGQTLAGRELGAQYWWDNIRQPVAFDLAVRTAITEHDLHAFIEIGPHPVLRDYVLQVAKAIDAKDVAAMATLRRPSAGKPAPELPVLREAVAEAYALATGDPAALFPAASRQTALPATVWIRQRHWRGFNDLPDAAQFCEREHPLLGSRVPGADGRWIQTMQACLQPHLLDHRVQDAAIFPAAGYIEMLAAGGHLLHGEGALRLENFEILRPMVIADDIEPIVQSSLEVDDGRFTIMSKPAKAATDWTLHCKGRVLRLDAPPAEPVDLAGIAAGMPVTIAAERHYAECRRRGLAYGPAYQGVQQIMLSPADAERREALGRITLAEVAGDPASFHGHPAIVDGALQVLIALIAQNDPRACATIPVFVETIVCRGAVPRAIMCHVVLRRESERSGLADITLTDRDGVIVMQLLGARFQKVEFVPATQTLIAEDWRIDADWQPTRSVLPDLPDVDRLDRAFAPAQDDAGLGAAFDRLAGAYAIAALVALADGEDDFTIASLATTADVDDDQRPLLRALVAMAQGDGYLARDPQGGRLSFADGVPLPDAGALVRDLMLAAPAWAAELVALSAAGSALVDRLRGVALPRVAMVEILEDGAPSRAAAHDALALLVRDLVAQWPAQRPIRVLDWRGGTGGRAACVLPLLPPERSDYLFVEADEGLRARAQHRHGASHFFRTAAPEALRNAAHDVILTDNATDADTLSGALAPGGLVIVLAQLPHRVWTLIHGAGEPAELALVDQTHQVMLQQTGPLGSQLVVIRGGIAPAVPPAIVRDGVARVLIVGEGEAATPFVAELAATLAAPVRVIGDDLSDAALASLIAEAPAAQYIHLAGWNRTGPIDDRAALFAYQDLRCYSLVALVKAIETAGADPRLTIVTRGALASIAQGPRDPFQATALGLGRVLANENPRLKVQAIDVHADADDRAAAQDLARALLDPGEEGEVQLCDGLRLVNRVRKTSHAELAQLQPDCSAPQAARLEVAAGGGLDSLAMVPIARRAPGEDEIEIAVGAAGLNFRDVLWAMGMLPEEALEYGFAGATIGMECAGVVTRVGSAVRDLRAGDRVMGFASSTFASHVTTRAAGIGHLPANVSLAEGATIPTTFITAWYALHELARLRPGETVLIHGAAGGVGLAALQIAKHLGATVFATAGAADKQRLVRDMGADHVMSSRSLAFADDVMALTGGKGVDVVLNSLAGEAITRGLQILRPFGRFLEIGKRDLYGNSRIGLRPFRQNLSYFGIDADTLLIERPDLAARLFAEITALFADGTLRPLPYQAFPLDRAGEAFRLMQASRHIGKIVLTVPETRRAVADVAKGPATGGTWVVSGGLSGFGLASARWLAEQGVTHLALLGRRGAETDEAQAALAWFAEMRVTVLPLACDVADRVSLGAALDTVRAQLPPIVGVLHAAAVIEDAPVVMIEREQAHRVQGAKIQGAWNFHELTRDDPIAAFVLYSSSAAVVGNPGQGIYVGANLFLDALAQLRRAQGRPALSVAWGAIKGAGFLTRNTQVEDMLASRAGMGATPYHDALRELGHLLAIGATRVAASQFNLMRLGQALPATRRPRFEKLVPQGVSVAADGGGEWAEALAAMNEDERAEVLTTLVRDKVAQVIGAAASQIEIDKPLAELGLDSLMAVELAEALEADIGKPISVMQMIQAGSVGGVVTLVQRAFRPVEAVVPPAAAAAVRDAA
jgi:acyl transferase domain-containing protein/NADPH:quinone reductase-like Zn-dependent oxidoreductase/NADP-dependent 3-hydroxy acid dehydrogenase YdfG/acyl carrier protein